MLPSPELVRPLCSRLTVRTGAAYNSRRLNNGLIPTTEQKDAAMAGNIVQLNDSNFQQEVTQSPIPVLVDFWAPWCGPCRMLAPTIEEISKDYDGKVKVCKLNTDEAPTIAGGFDISSIPTVLLFKDGKVVDRLVGLNPKKKFQDMLSRI
jgi:thioredoxin 1